MTTDELDNLWTSQLANSELFSHFIVKNFGELTSLQIV